MAEFKYSEKVRQLVEEIFPEGHFARIELKTNAYYLICILENYSRRTFESREILSATSLKSLKEEAKLIQKAGEAYRLAKEEYKVNFE